MNQYSTAEVAIDHIKIIIYNSSTRGQPVEILDFVPTLDDIQNVFKIHSEFHASRLLMNGFTIIGRLNEMSYH